MSKYLFEVNYTLEGMRGGGFCGRFS